MVLDLVQNQGTARKKGKIAKTKNLLRKSEEALWELRESNPRPSACKADALNQLS